MSIVDRYLKYAEQCTLLAQEPYNSGHKRVLLAMAEEWLFLAERAVNAQ